MARITWDDIGKRYYTTGVDHVTLYVQNTDGTYQKGVPFNGVSAIEESPSGAESTAIYADNIKYLDLTSKEDYGCSITAYSSPEEFDVCDGTATPVKGLKIGQQTRRRFGLVYRTNIGNDTEGNDYGYAYHIVYNCKAAVSSKSHNTINDSPEATELSWEVTTTDVNINGYKPSAKLTVYTRDLTPEILTALENELFGSDEGGTDATLPTPERIMEILGGVQPTETYVEVTPVGTENPSEEGWYEYDSTNDTYVATEDTTVVSGKTYYEKVVSQG